VSDRSEQAQNTNTALREFIVQSGADIAVNGIAGSAGLLPSVFALEEGIDLALANKETIVMAGALIRTLAEKTGCKILPVDSEHSAVFHLLTHFPREAVHSIILTASGGPFRTLDAEKFSEIRAEDALKHPTWTMGKKITVDSATLANKGLEVIEARYLFDMPPEKIRVVVHPQSIVHSLIRTVDGVLYAQMSKPDMRHPILNALFWPETTENSLELLDLAAGIELSFSPPRFDDFPMLPLAFEAAKSGQADCIAYNAANEIAVAAFLDDKITFTDFAPITRRVMAAVTGENPASFDDVFTLDSKCRRIAKQLIGDTVCQR
jgi:1-deoxy-D-xylulose-5-phosphate reductoisomerase